MMSPIIAVLTALLVTAPADGSPDSVASFGCRSPHPVAKTNVKTVSQAYARQSVSIVDAALFGKADDLADMIVPTASFTLFQGDVGIGPRSTGPGAAIEFAKQIAPATYRFSSGSPGPWSTDPCDPIETQVMITGHRPGEVITATFQFRDGLLAAVTASRIDLVEGSFADSPEP